MWASKVHGVSREIDAATQERFDLGNMSERLTIELFKMYTGIQVKRDKKHRIRFQAKWPWLGFTVEALSLLTI